MADCIFCKIIKGEIPSTPVYQDKDCIVIPDIHPQASVHLLVIPKKHVLDVTEADSALLSKLSNVVKKIITDKKLKDFRLVHNGGGAAFVKHLHIHILGSVAVDRNL
jgi:histidine triad (HIT) family protein